MEIALTLGLIALMAWIRSGITPRPYDWERDGE